MHQSDYSQEQYENDFLKDEKKERQEKALERALDTRKFEIELYWKRAAYFWTFIGAIFAGFFAVQVSGGENGPNEVVRDVSVVLSCIGFVFSVGWLCVNRGSKHWQENWEAHVDMLEDDISGPLYKVVLTRGKPKRRWDIVKHWLTGPSPLSVSKINQLISLYVSLMWAVLLWYSLPEFSLDAPINWLYVIVVFLSLLASITFFVLGRTQGDDVRNRATIRKAKIGND